MKEGIERKACPVCGGQIIVSEHWAFSYDRVLQMIGFWVGIIYWLENMDR